MSLVKQIFSTDSWGLPLQARQAIANLMNAMTGLQLSGLPKKDGHLDFYDVSKGLDIRPSASPIAGPP